jgi:hypothetical protein
MRFRAERRRYSNHSINAVIKSDSNNTGTGFITTLGNFADTKAIFSMSKYNKERGWLNKGESAGDIRFKTIHAIDTSINAVARGATSREDSIPAGRRTSKTHADSAAVVIKAPSDAERGTRRKAGIFPLKISLSIPPIMMIPVRAMYEKMNDRENPERGLTTS